MKENTAKRAEGLRCPLLEDPESLTEGQAAALDALKSMGTALWRGHLPKEAFRAVFRAQGEEEARGLLGEWPSWACRCRIPQFAELSKKVRRKARGIVRSVAPGVSNARVEAANDKVKVAIGQAYGFRSIDNLIALVMLRCSPLEPCPPGRARKPKRKRGRGLQAAPAWDSLPTGTHEASFLCWLPKEYHYLWAGEKPSHWNTSNK